MDLGVPHSTCSEIGILLQEVGAMSLSGDPGCGQRSQESPLYNLDGNLVLQLGDPQTWDPCGAGGPCGLEQPSCG
ncbi:hypothetical protein APTSU1_000702400 [Apodemus speciosus]|uniref:Uncharacterized protein n=1 Tax=Apodemus speciosus TaxID=105296 RepID=A0ABQ0EXM3_APOSI